MTMEECCPNYLPGCVILDAEEQGDLTDRLNILSRVTIVLPVTKVVNLKVRYLISGKQTFMNGAFIQWEVDTECQTLWSKTHNSFSSLLGKLSSNPSLCEISKCAP